MKVLKKGVAAAGVLALAVGGLALVAPSAVQATGVTYGAITVSPVGPYAGGETVTVNYTGITPTAVGNGGGYAIGICIGGGQPQTGPPSCSPDLQYFVQSTPLPDGHTTVTIPARGANPGFTDPGTTGWTCNNGVGHECNISLNDFKGNGPTQIPIVYTATVTTPTVNSAAKVSGSAHVGRTLTCSGSFIGATSVTHAWLRNGATISGAHAAAYKLGVADYNRHVACTATGVNSAGSVASTSSALTVGLGTLVKVKAPSVTGTAKVGRTVTARSGSWSPGATSYSYRWLRNGKAISHATKSAYKVGKADKGKRISVLVTAHRTAYASASATSRSVRVS